MYWYCELCTASGVSWNEDELADEKARHYALEHPEEAPEEDEDTVLPAKYVAWATAAVLGLLATRWHALGALVPFAALIAWTVG